LHYSPDLEPRQILEGRLLTQESFAEIASRFCIETKAIEYYESLFFNVRDRMQDSVWIRKVIWGPPEVRSPHERGVMTDEQLGYFYRLLGYFGGPLVLDTVISGLAATTMPQNESETTAWFEGAQDQIVLVRATVAASTLPINQRNSLKLIKLAKRISARSANTVDDEKMNEDRMLIMETVKSGMGDYYEMVAKRLNDQ
jgi:hypothetical protein